MFQETFDQNQPDWLDTGSIFRLVFVPGVRADITRKRVNDTSRFSSFSVQAAIGSWLRFFFLSFLFRSKEFIYCRKFFLISKCLPWQPGFFLGVFFQNIRLSPRQHFQETITSRSTWEKWKISFTERKVIGAHTLAFTRVRVQARASYQLQREKQTQTFWAILWSEQSWIQCLTLFDTIFANKSFRKYCGPELSERRTCGGAILISCAHSHFSLELEPAGRRRYHSHQLRKCKETLFSERWRSPETECSRSPDTKSCLLRMWTPQPQKIQKVSIKVTGKKKQFSWRPNLIWTPLLWSSFPCSLLNSGRTWVKHPEKWERVRLAPWEWKGTKGTPQLLFALEWKSCLPFGAVISEKGKKSCQSFSLTLASGILRFGRLQRCGYSVTWKGNPAWKIQTNKSRRLSVDIIHRQQCCISWWPWEVWDKCLLLAKMWSLRQEQGSDVRRRTEEVTGAPKMTISTPGERERIIWETGSPSVRTQMVHIEEKIVWKNAKDQALRLRKFREKAIVNCTSWLITHNGHDAVETLSPVAILCNWCWHCMRDSTLQNPYERHQMWEVWTLMMARCQKLPLIAGSPQCSRSPHWEAIMSLLLNRDVLTSPDIGGISHKKRVSLQSCKASWSWFLKVVLSRWTFISIAHCRDKMWPTRHNSEVIVPRPMLLLLGTLPSHFLLRCTVVILWDTWKNGMYLYQLSLSLSLSPSLSLSCFQKGTNPLTNNCQPFPQIPNHLTQWKTH